MTTETHYPGVCSLDGLQELARELIVPQPDDDVLVGDGPMGSTASVTVPDWTVAGQRFTTEVTELYSPYEAPSELPLYFSCTFGQAENHVHGWVQLADLRWVGGKAIATWEATDNG